MATIQFTVSVDVAIYTGSTVPLVVTSERLVVPLIQHLPEGRRLWVFEEGTRLYDLVRGVARALGLIDGMGRSMIRQFDPARATWGLSDWERILKLEAGDLSLAQRRANIIAAIRARGGQSIAYWKSLLIALGYVDVVVTRLGDPFRCGDRCGKRLQGPDWMFALEFTMTSINGLDDLMQEIVLASVRATTKVKFTFL